MLLKTSRRSCARHQVEGDSFGQGLRLDHENDIFKGFSLLSEFGADVQFSMLVDLLNRNV